MSRSRYLILHKTEWNRLKRCQSPDKRESEKNDYLKSSIEQSQNWIKMWPDTVQGLVHQLETQKNIKHAQQIESVKKFVAKKKHEIKMESIKKARDMIFEDSCYGRQLLSALVESKTLEERKQQVLFRKNIKQTAELLKLNESQASSIQNASEMESIEIKRELLRKQRNKDVARFNQQM
ncbi:uncharacterized protein LOC124537034 [Vanessa cardui]|uniref:uncharacterized protein LOC124537034 n=1 Tax=Vanessa cardui TaxID=171605 RepID=UPI001F13EE86|nr:uncharacterized protein LOC124537034 [Vanessa cardui]